MTAASEEKAIQKGEDQRNEQALAASVSSVAADVEAKATAELRERHRAEFVEELRVEAAKGSKSFGGQVFGTENYVAVTTETFGQPAVEIKPNGWVGEGFIVPAVRVKELGKLIGLIKNLPEQD